MAPVTMVTASCNNGAVAAAPAPTPDRSVSVGKNRYILAPYDRYKWSHNSPINGLIKWVTGMITPIKEILSPCSTCWFLLGKNMEKLSSAGPAIRQRNWNALGCCSLCLISQKGSSFHGFYWYGKKRVATSATMYYLYIYIYYIYILYIYIHIYNQRNQGFRHFSSSTLWEKRDSQLEPLLCHYFPFIRPAFQPLWLWKWYLREEVGWPARCWFVECNTKLKHKCLKCERWDAELLCWDGKNAWSVFSLTSHPAKKQNSF